MIFKPGFLYRHAFFCFVASLLLGQLLPGSVHLEGPVPDKPGSSGQVVCLVEPFSNYVFHLMAVANIAYDSQYAEKHADSIFPEDLAILRNKRGLLKWGDGETGSLTFMFVFVPVYLNLESEAELKTYFSLLENGIRTQDARPWFQEYGKRLENLKEWLTPPDFFSTPFARYKDLLEPVSKLSAVYIRNYGPYLEQVWPGEKQRLETAAAALNPVLKQRNLVATWQKLTGQEFKFPRYEILLVSAAENGPSANSVGYERNVFFAGDDLDYLEKFISHEVGTHILFDLFREFMDAGHDFGILYRAYECLAMHFNTMIYPDKKYAWNYGEDFFLELYAKLSNNNPGYCSRELLKAALQAAEK